MAANIFQCQKKIAINDIGTVSGNTDEKMQLDIKLIRNVRVFAVEKLESYTSCVKCSINR